MRLLSPSEFTVRLASPYTSSEPASSELRLNGRPTGQIVSGQVLEAAVEWHGFRVAFLTEDIPFEDMLRIYMFDTNMALVDAAVLGAMYSTGTFAALNLEPPNAITFRFFRGVTWRLILLSEQEFGHFRIEDEPLSEGTPEASRARFGSTAD